MLKCQKGTLLIQGYETRVAPGWCRQGAAHSRAKLVEVQLTPTLCINAKPPCCHLSKQKHIMNNHISIYVSYPYHILYIHTHIIYIHSIILKIMPYITVFEDDADFKSYHQYHQLLSHVASHFHFTGIIHLRHNSPKTMLQVARNTYGTLVQEIAASPSGNSRVESKMLKLLRSMPSIHTFCYTSSQSFPQQNRQSSKPIIASRLED